MRGFGPYGAEALGRRCLQVVAINRGGKRWLAGVVTALLFLVLGGVASVLSSGQLASGPQTPTGGALHTPGDNDQRHPFPPDLEEKARKMRNEQRQKQIVSDTGRLLTLARELEVEVSSLPAAPFAPGTLKKAQEVEKLARSVKDKMKAD